MADGAACYTPNDTHGRAGTCPFPGPFLATSGGTYTVTGCRAAATGCWRGAGEGRRAAHPRLRTAGRAVRRGAGGRMHTALWLVRVACNALDSAIIAANFCRPISRPFSPGYSPFSAVCCFPPKLPGYAICLATSSKNGSKNGHVLCIHVRRNIYKIYI